MSLGLKSGRKPMRQQCERFTPVPEDELAPQPRSRSASGSSLLRRVRSLREKDHPSSAKESAKEMKRTVSPDLSMQKRSNSAVVRGASRSSHRSAGRKGGMDRSISSSPHRAKKRYMLGVPDGLRPTSPSPARPLKSAMKKSGSPTRVHSGTPSPVPGRSRSSERKTPLDVFSRLYPGSGGSGNHLLGESDSRFAGINDTLRIRKKKDSKSGMVDFDGVSSNAQASGNMHEFTDIMVSSPMWCDRCGAFIWGLYKHAVKCRKCNLTCHKKCMESVVLECNVQAFEELSRRMSITEAPQPVKNGGDAFSELVDSVKVTKVRQKRLSHDTIGAVEPGGYTTAEQRHTLQHRINLYNQRQTPAHQLKFVDLTTDFQGFVRVHMCVTRPIHVSAGVTKNSWYGLMKPVRAKSRRHARGKGKAPRRDAGRECGDNETTFYLPTDANRLVHISNTTTTLELISILLKKFCVTDHPNKFALFEEYKGDTRRMFNEEHPLEILVDSASEERYSKLVLRDNTDGSIQWSGFSLPELSNFSQMLQREEQLHVKELRDKFTTWKRILLEVMQEKCLQEAETAEKLQTGPVHQPQIPAH